MARECRVEERNILTHIATLPIIKLEVREVISALQTNEGRLDWLEREHKMKNKSLNLYVCVFLCAWTIVIHCLDQYFPVVWTNMLVCYEHQ
jgi:hypothetical protein